LLPSFFKWNKVDKKTESCLFHIFPIWAITFCIPLSTSCTSIKFIIPKLSLTKITIKAPVSFLFYIFWIGCSRNIFQNIQFEKFKKYILDWIFWKVYFDLSEQLFWILFFFNFGISILKSSFQSENKHTTKVRLCFGHTIITKSIRIH